MNVPDHEPREPITYLTFDDAREILARIRQLAADASTGLFNQDYHPAIVARTADLYELIIYLEEFLASYARARKAQNGH